jgi:hypothetical protein
MSIQSPYQTPGLNAAGITGNVALVQNPDAALANLMFGRNNDAQISNIHGLSYAANVRSEYFICPVVGTTGAAILAFGGTTSGPVFGNPVGTNVMMEIKRLRIMPATALVVDSVNFGLEFGVVPVSTTYQTAYTGLVGATASNKCKVWNAVTIVAMTYLRTLGVTNYSTTFGPGTGWQATGTTEWTFDGNLVIEPGFAVNVATTTTQVANKFFVDVEWAEWPM